MEGMPLGMVKPPPGATEAQAASMYQVTVPVESEVAVKGTPAGPALTGLPKLSWSCTVITLPSPGEAPAVKVRAGVMNTSFWPLAGVMLKVAEVAPVSGAEAAVSV